MVLIHHPTVAARPITTHRHAQVELVAIAVTAASPHATVYLSPDQLDCVHAALTTLAPGKYGRFAVGCGAEVTQVRRPDGDDIVSIRSAHPFGSGECAMTAREAGALRHRLGQLAFTYLHENVWGGEDATAQ